MNRMQLPVIGRRPQSFERPGENYHNHREVEFHKACALGDMSWVRSLLRAGVTKISREYGLVFAARASHFDLVMFLVTGGWVDPSSIAQRALEVTAGCPLMEGRIVTEILLRDRRVQKQSLTKKRHPNITKLLGESRLRMICLLGPSFHQVSGGLPLEVVTNILGFMESSIWGELELRQIVKCLFEIRATTGNASLEDATTPPAKVRKVSSHRG